VTCLWTDAGDLELWDRRTDVHLATEAAPDLSAVVALPEGCVTLSDEAVRLHGRTGSSREILGRRGAVAWDGERLLVADGREIRAFDERGEPGAVFLAGPGVSALSGEGSSVVAGFVDGTLEVLGPEGEARPPGLPFDQTPSSAVVRIVPGPMGTLAVGYANGLLGIWGSRGGGRLYAERLHGAVVHLLYEEGRLYAATELGDHRTLDLGVFRDGWCDVLREVWEAVPVVWRAGAPELSAPPPDHPCHEAAPAARDPGAP
jgi:hypothetical protein